MICGSYMDRTLSLKVCAIKAPGFGENRKAALQDLATLTGGQVGSLSYLCCFSMTICQMISELCIWLLYCSL